MGHPVSIAYFAKKMIIIYGLIPDIYIKIVNCRLSHSVKLYEDFLNDGENICNTNHDKIIIAKVRDVAFEEIKNHFNSLISIIN